MSQFNELVQKLDSKKSIGYSLIRIFLGGILFIRGWLLFSNPDAIMELAGEEQIFLKYSFIAVAHLLGGLFIAIGYFTRIGTLIQIPIVFGAAFLIHNNDGLMMGGQSFELAALVFFLLIIYFVFGAGSYSVYHYINKKKLNTAT